MIRVIEGVTTMGPKDNQDEVSSATTPSSPQEVQRDVPSVEKAEPEAKSLSPETFTPSAPDVPPAEQTTPSETLSPSTVAPQQNISPEPTTSSHYAPVTTTPPSGPGSPKPRKHRAAIIILVILLIVAIIGGIYAASLYKNDKKTADEHVKVGVMMAFSGGSSSMGYGAMKGIQLAKKQFGANNIELVQMDSKCDPKETAEAIKKLIAQKVVAIIGEGCSSASVAALPAANNSKTIMISPSASSPTLSIPDDYFFRVVPPDTLQGSYIAQAIYDRGIRNVAVFYTNEPYGSGMNKVFQEKFEALGGKVVATTTAEPDVITLNNQIQQLKDANPEAIFIAPNSVVSATAVINLAREAGITVPLYGADIMYDDTIIKNAPTASEGLTITSFPTGTKSFKQALQNEYKTTEQLYAAPQAYDAFHAIYKAVKDGARSGEDIKKMLPNIKFDGVSGNISFDMNGDLAGKNYKYDLFQVKNGAFELIEQ